MNDKLTTQLAATTAEIEEVQAAIAGLVRDLDERLGNLQIVQNGLKAKLMAAMERNHIKEIDNDYIRIVYVAPSERVTLDVTKIKTKYPDLYATFARVTPVSASVRIKLKD